MPTTKIDKTFKQARVILHSALVSRRGNALPPLRWTRQAVSFINDLAGRPLCSEEEFLQREETVAAAEAELQRAREHTAAPKQREAAPVVLYVTDQDHRTPRKMEDILKARDIPYKVNDVTTDEATASWALTQAHAAEFPLVFVAGEPVGGLHELTQCDVSGELLKKVYG